MNARRIAPAEHVDGEVRVAGDKSISHRALIVGAIARGRSYVGNVSPAADVEATARCLRDCGVWVRPFGAGRVAIEGSGPGCSLEQPSNVLDCANSGTTLRLLTGVLAGHPFEAELDGDASLRTRPMRRVAEPLCAMGAQVTTSAGGTAPIHVAGTSSLHGIEWTMPVASAQLKSAILLAALSADSTTTVMEPAASRDHTERLLRACGIELVTTAGQVAISPGTPQPFGLRVPGDISSAAFFLALAAARPGWCVSCADAGLNPARTGILDVLRDMGARVEVSVVDEAVEPRGNVTVRGADLHAVTVDGERSVRCIDEIPVIAVLATQAEGTTVIRDAAELRTKESDRIEQVARGLRAFGATCETYADGIAVEGPVLLQPASVDAAGDHRLAMAWAIAGALAKGADTLVQGGDVVAVSFPGFFDELARLTA